MAEQGAQSTRMQQRIAVPEKGKVLLQWIFPEYEKPERGKLWYVIAIGITVLLLGYAIRDGNFLFALIIVLFALIIFTHHRSQPLDIPFMVYETGIQIGDRFYLFREIKSFAIIYEPPVVKRLYIKPRNAILRQEISIPLFDQDPIKLRSLFLDYLNEDLEREQESGSDALARLLKL